MSELPRGIALIAGVDAYSGKIRPLRSAVADARALAAVLGDAHDYEVTLLVDEEATGQAITAALESHSLQAHDEARPFLLYFAGHGVARGDGDDGPQGFLMPYDAQAGEPATWIPMTAVRTALDSIPSRHLLVVLDCCFAGAFRWSATRDSEWVKEPLYDSQYERYLKGTAWQALTSASHDEKALDVVPGRDNTRDHVLENGHSPFAAALLRGLAGDADTSRPGVEPDGVITATELYQYTFDLLVPAGEESHQTPGIWPLRNDNTGQFVFRNPRQPLNTRKDLPLTDANNPWLGLAAYSEDDAPLFFGRERWVNELLSKLRDEHEPTLIAVVGASGTGKSSVVKAGVLPRLAQAKDQASGSAGSEQDDATRWTIVRSPRLSAEPTVELGTVREALAAASNRRLLLIDQFEELYTQCRDNDERDRYLGGLRELMDAGETDKVVITLRSDFEPRPRQHAALADLWQAGRCLVPAFTGAELRECIEGPAHVRALYFDPPELIDSLVEDVTAMPGALPMLSFALAEMYRQAQQRRRRSGALDRALTQADYDQTGGVVGSLHRRATELFDAHAKSEQQTITRVFLRMLAQDGARLSRRRVAREELQFAGAGSPEQELVDNVVDEYVEARLLVANDGTLEPAHDTLVSAWDRLQEWLSDAGPQNLIRALWRAASDWRRSERDAGVTWHDDPRLPQALSTLDELNVLETEFVQASETVRRSRARRLLVGGVAVVAVVAAIAVVALIQRQAAVEQQAIAESQRDRATASALLANAQAQDNPVVQARLLSEFHPRGLTPPARAAEVARNALDGMLAGDAFKVVAAGESFDGGAARQKRDDMLLSDVPDAAAEGEGFDLRRRVGPNYISTQTLQRWGDGLSVYDWWAPDPIILFSVDSIALTRRHPDLVRDKPGIRSAKYTQNGRSVAATLDDGGVAYWVDPISDATLGYVQRGEVADMASDWSGNVLLLARGRETEVVRIASAGAAVATLRSHAGDVLSVALGRDATRAVSGDANGAVQSWDVESGTLLGTREMNGKITDLVLGGRTGLVVAGNDRGEIAAWSATLQPVWAGRCRGSVTSLSLAPGEQAVAALCDGKPVVWRLGGPDTGRRIDPPEGMQIDHARLVLWPGSFRHDGVWLLGVEFGEAAYAWPLVTGVEDTTGDASVVDDAPGFELDDLAGNSVTVSRGDAASSRVFVHDTTVCNADIVGDRLLLRGAMGRVEVYDIPTATLEYAIDHQDHAQLLESGTLVSVRLAPVGRDVPPWATEPAASCTPWWDLSNAYFGEEATLGDEFALARERADVVREILDLDAQVQIYVRNMEQGVERSEALETRFLSGWPYEFPAVSDAAGDRIFVVASDTDEYAGLLFSLTSGPATAAQEIGGQMFDHAALSPDGQQLLIAADRPIPGRSHDDPKIYATSSTATPLRVLTGHSFVRHSAFSRDGKRLVTSDCNGKAKVWNTDGSGDPFVIDMGEQKGKVYCGPNFDPLDLIVRRPRAWFSDDSNYLLTMLGNGPTRRWAISYDALVERLSVGSYMCLTAPQREEFFAETPELATEAYDACMLDLGLPLAP